MILPLLTGGVTGTVSQVNETYKSGSLLRIPGKTITSPARLTTAEPHLRQRFYGMEIDQFPFVDSLENV